MRKTALVTIALGALAAAAVVAVEAFTDKPPRTADAKAAELAHIALVDASGKPTSLVEPRGLFKVVLFGYMTCPDVCPISLAYMSNELALLGADADRVRGVFVSVDPKRDQPAKLGEYARHFDERIVAYTGEEPQLRAAAKELGAYFDYEPVEGGRPGDYTVVHSGNLYILDPQGRFVTALSPPLKRKALSDALRPLLAAAAH
jgi:protein SCO1/2